MDPNENLKLARVCAKKLATCANADLRLIAIEMRDAFEALDALLSNGGNLPVSWCKAK
jgi:hypothetical protein